MIESVDVETRGNKVYLVLHEGEETGELMFTLEDAQHLVDSLTLAIRHVEEHAALGN